MTTPHVAEVSVAIIGRTTFGGFASSGEFRGPDSDAKREIAITS